MQGVIRVTPRETAWSTGVRTQLCLISTVMFGCLLLLYTRRLNCQKLSAEQSPIFKLLLTPGLDSTESIPCENQFRRGIDSLGRREGGPTNEFDSSFKIKHFIRHGRLDSILGPKSIQGINFTPITRPKIPSQSPALAGSVVHHDRR